MTVVFLVVGVAVMMFAAGRASDRNCSKRDFCSYVALGSIPVTAWLIIVWTQ